MTLRFLPSSTARCARIYATGEDGRTQRQTDALARVGRDLQVGVMQSKELGNSVTLEAHGYDTTDCTGPWTDDSNIVQRAFTAGSVRDDVLLVLDGRPVTNSDAGVELCDNAVDDDGDSLVDCKDLECDSRSCGAPNFCVNMQCTAVTGEVDCRNGSDDDGNGKTDCEDDNCATRTCDAGSPCVTGATCTARLCSGAPVVCNAPSECQVPGSGMCMMDGGCGYAERTGSCGDAGTCTGGVCGLTFPFPPTNIPRTFPEAQVGGLLRLDCGETRFDTDTAMWTNLCASQTPPPTFLQNQPGGAPVLRVIGVRGLEVPGMNTFVVTGTLPLAVAVFGDATVGGRIVANADGGTDGAGSPGSSCGPSAGSNGVVGTRAGGGGGGHKSAGGRGGHADGTNNTGGSGGVATTDSDLSPLRGGCAGGFGAIPAGVAAAGGGGGGAFQLSVSGTLTVSGQLAANGGGGRAGPMPSGGGGGGGSGGGILLEAAMIGLTGNAIIVALGGGGGGGAEANDTGDDGQDGPINRGGANGGASAGSSAGNGGDGEDWDSPVEVGESSGGPTTAGGGGGGAFGRIVIRGPCTQGSNVESAPVIPNGDCTQL